MCHEDAEFMYAKYAAEQRAKEPVQETSPMPAPVAEPAGGLVAFLRGLLEKLGPAKTTVAAE